MKIKSIKLSQRLFRLLLFLLVLAGCSGAPARPTITSTVSRPKLPTQPVTLPTETPQPKAAAAGDRGLWHRYAPTREVYRLAVDEHAVWMVTEVGLSHLDRTTGTITDYTDMNWHNEDLSLALDTSGQVWIGFVYGTPFAPGDYVWLGVIKFDGQPWDAEARQTSYNYAFTNSAEYPSPPPLLAVDPRDRVWALDRYYHLLVMFDGQQWVELGRVEIPGYINAMTIDETGRLWFGSTEGAYVSDENALPPGSAGEALLSPTVTGNITAIAGGGSGHMWFGTAESGVIHFDGTTATTYTPADGLASHKIQAIAADQAGQVGVVYRKQVGVSRFDGTSWTTYTVADGLPSNKVFDLAVDEAGHVWLGTDTGLSEFVPGLRNNP